MKTLSEYVTSHLGRLSLLAFVWR